MTLHEISKNLFMSWNLIIYTEKVALDSTES